jgi:hypothetical protein
MQIKSMIPPITSQVRLLSCAFLLLPVMVGFRFYPPFLMLALFLIWQVIVKVVTFKQNTTELPFMENLLVGPAKVALSMLMIAYGVPADNTDGGLAWIAIALLFLASGLKNLSALFSNQSASTDGTNWVEPETARQRAKADREQEKSEKVTKEEEILFAELAGYLANNDPTSEGNK